MDDKSAFFPMYGPYAGTGQSVNAVSVTVAATNASATASAMFPGSLDTNGFVQLQVANKTTAWAHVSFGRFGNIRAATVASDIPIAPGSVEVLTVAAEVSGASVILDAAPGAATSVIFTRGMGT